MSGAQGKGTGLAPAAAKPQTLGAWPRRHGGAGGGAVATWKLAMGAVLAVGALWALPARAQGPAQPRVQQILPSADVLLGERAVFALKLARAPAGPPRAQCDVWGIRSAVPVEVLAGAQRSTALKALGVPEAERLAAPAKGGPVWLALRCQTRLPDGTAASLRWLDVERPPEGGDKGPGFDNWGAQRFDYGVRSDWPVAVQCSRTNAQAGCNPLEPVLLRFTAPVKAEALARVRLRAADGQTVAPEPPEAHDGIASELAFKRLPPNQTFGIQWPASLPDAQGRDLLATAKRGDTAPSGARARAPLVVHLGPYPPLAKFGANFGIAEKAIGGVVPLTVRAVEGSAGRAPLTLRSLRIGDEVGIIEALRTLARVQSADNSRASTPDDDDGWTGESGNSAETAASPTRQKLRYPFRLPTPAAKDASRLSKAAAANAPPLDSRGISWLQQLPGMRQRNLPRQVETAAMEVLGIPLSGPGLHLLEVESPALGRSLMEAPKPMFVRAGAVVTDLGVHLHWSDRSTAVWVTRLSSGQPVAGAAIGLYNCQGKRLAAGHANAQGWLQLDGAFARELWSCPLYAFAREGDDLGLASSQWQRGIETWRFESLAQIYEPTGPQIVHAVLARNLLRPGETFHARLHWRRVTTQGGLAAPLPAELPSSLALVHQGSGERMSSNLAWDARGHADLVLRLPEGIKRGVWRIDGGNVDISGAEFRVEDFRLPVLKAEVLAPQTPQVLPAALPAKPAATPGASASAAPVAGSGPGVLLTVPVTVRLGYLSGGPAVGEPVQLSHRLLPHQPRFDSHPGFVFGQAAPEAPTEGDGPEAAPGTEADGTLLAPDQTLRLGEDGTRSLQVRLAKPPREARTLLTEMEYRDPNGETYRAQGRTVLWPAALALGVKTDLWASGQQRSAEFVALNPQGQPQAGVKVTVQGGFEGSVVHRRKTTGGFYSYHQERRDFVPAPLCEGVTGPDGRFVCRFQAALGDLDSGDYRLQAEARDAQGRLASTRSQLWLYNGGELWFAQGDHDRMDVLAEQRRYKPGEVATLQVRSPFREATAWVNVMRNGGVVDTLVLPISGSQPTIQLPIKPSYAPNVFINVLVVRGRVAEPAATALVDLARPAYKLGIAHLEVGTEAQRLNVQVRTDKPSYQTRETAQVSIQVSAAVGALPAERSATVFAIDEALLELMPNGSWDLLPAMLARRGYGFETASAAMQVIGKRHFGRKAVPPGGGGGKSATRELFDTLLLWRSDVVLDAQGQATVAVPINDSLTRFRVVVVADAGADRFGMGQASFTATRDLQLLSGLPATVREGDQFDAVFTVRNAGSSPLQATVTAQLNDQPLPPRQVTLAPQASQRLSWPVAVPDLPGEGLAEQRWRIAAQASTPVGPRQDALAVKQAVGSALNPRRYTIGSLSLGVPAASASAGASPSANPSASAASAGPGTTSPLTLPIRPPAGSVAGKGEVVITLSPGLAADPEPVRDYMRQYPFYCLEQRTSKAVSLKDKALWQLIHDGIDAYITLSGLLSYYPQQASGDEGYDVLTAFVLSAAHEAGWALPEAARKTLLDALERFVQGKLERRFSYYDDGALGLTERKLLALEALARHGRAKPALAESLKLDAAALPQLSHRAIVQWLDVLQRSRWPQAATLQAVAIAELNSRLVDDQRGGLRLKPRAAEQRWYWMYSEDASMARLALLAQSLPALADRADQLAMGAVHLQQGGGHWWATQANVWGSLMLDQRARQLAGGVRGQTTVAVGTRTATHDWAAQPQGGSYRFAATGLSPDAPGALALLHRGRGQPAVIAHATAWAPLAQAAAQGGVGVTRQVTPLKQQVPGQWRVGDIAEVQLRFQVPAGTGWLVVSDPLPPGATVLGNGLRGQDPVTSGSQQRGWRRADGSWEAWPAYVERSFTHVRAYYEHLWGQDFTLTYQVRLNTAGRFLLPPSRAEAMYDATLWAHRPNAPLEVK